MENKLERLEDFQAVLKNYQISEDSRRVLLKTSLVVLVAPTSSGRNTIIRELERTGEYHFIVTDTTRHPRKNNGVMEQNGVEYWFRTEPEMLADIKAGKFLEAEIIHQQQVSGISMRELELAQLKEKIAITDVDIGGMKNIVSAKPDTVAIVVLPPSFEEWQRRLRGRGKMSQMELNRRLLTARVVFATAIEQPYTKLVINDDLSQAAQQVHYLARYGQMSLDQQAQGRNLAEQLYIETSSYLQSQGVNLPD